MSHIHNPVNPRVMAISAAMGTYIDQLGIRQDVTYLVYNGIEVNEAVRRIVDYKRRLMVWGICAVPVLFWSGVFIGFGFYRGLPGLVLGKPSYVLLGVLFGTLGTVMVYLLVMKQFWMWRQTCAGIPWEESRSKWLPSVRPKELRVPVPAEPGDQYRRTLAYALGFFVLTLWVGPITGGMLSGLSMVLTGGAQ